MKHRNRNRLQQLREDNLANHQRQMARGYVMNNAAGEDSTTIYLYDAIDYDPYWGFTSGMMAEILDQIETSRILLRINSPGGDVFEARTMSTLLGQHSAQVDVSIDGLAASAATTVACAGDSRQIAAGGFYMIHKAWMLSVGNADDFRAAVAELDAVDLAIAEEYSRLTAMGVDEAMEYMAAETWFSAQEALDLGFVDSVWTAGEGDANASSRVSFKLRAFERPPAEVFESTLPDDARPDSDDPDREDPADPTEQPENLDDLQLGVPDHVRRMAAVI